LTEYELNNEKNYNYRNYQNNSSERLNCDDQLNENVLENIELMNGSRYFQKKIKPNMYVLRNKLKKFYNLKKNPNDPTKLKNKFIIQD
jgi:hypothetical protein